MGCRLLLPSFPQRVCLSVCLSVTCLCHAARIGVLFGWLENLDSQIKPVLGRGPYTPTASGGEVE